ncbi:hypothetical protein Ocin01_16782 [Orchesella cincta]|uniref:Uncharacterized protein n=1 Tax=Orchesella cincta TaxID=48709 RepID=A0A1D2MAA0_ORCCI|nr:hypothetical protein Ocin01_16782 [Orchesella cincta]
MASTKTISVGLCLLILVASTFLVAESQVWEACEVLCGDILDNMPMIRGRASSRGGRRPPPPPRPIYHGGSGGSGRPEIPPYLGMIG